MLAVNDATDAYHRPSADAQVFAPVETGFTAQVNERTADGWVGFDPAIAQAANIGIFRLRWLHFDDVSLSGDCVSVSQASWVPEPGVCYFMPMESVTVYTGANTSASVLTTLDVGEFAAVLGLSGSGWAQLDVGNGNSGTSGTGWVEQSTLNMSGSTCDELPAVTP
jgi:hypothetical protein